MPSLAPPLSCPLLLASSHQHCCAIISDHFNHVRHWRLFSLADCALTLAVSGAAMLIDEPRVPPGSVLLGTSAPGVTGLAASPLVAQVVGQARALWAAISRRDILLPTVFVFLWQVPHGGRACVGAVYGGRVACRGVARGQVRPNVYGPQAALSVQRSPVHRPVLPGQ